MALHRTQRLVATIVALAVVVLPARMVAPHQASAARPTGTIIFYNYTVDPATDALLRQDVKAFEASHPGAHVNLIMVPPDQYASKSLLAVASNQPPDIAWYDMVHYAWWKKGLIKDLTPYIQRDRVLSNPALYSTQYNNPYKFDGTHYFAVSTGADGMMTFYNKSLFDKAHLPYPPTDFAAKTWTWQDFLRDAQRLTLDRNGKHPTDAGFDPAHVVQWGTSLAGSMSAWWGWQIIPWSYGAQLVDKPHDPTRFLMNSPKMISSLQFLQDLIYKYHVAPTPSQATALFSGDDFATGKVGLVLDGGWGLVPRRHITRFKWDITFLPRGPAGRFSPLWSAGFVITTRARNFPLAWEFARWAATESTWQRDQAVLRVPALRSVAKSVYSHPNQPGLPPHFLVRVECLRQTYPGDIWQKNWPQIQDKIWTPAFEKFWRGEISARQLVQQINDPSTAFLSRP